MSRRRLLVTLVCLSLLAVAGSTLVAGVNVTVESVEISPEQPVPGEGVTVSPTIRNLETSSEDLSIISLALRTASGPLIEYDRVRNPGTVAPGTTMTVPLRVSFDEPGTKSLRVHLTAETASEGGIQLTYPVTIPVRDQHPRVTVDVDRPTAGVGTTATVTVANGLSRDVRNLEVSLAGLPVDQPRRVASRLAPDETRTFTFSVTPAEPGRHEVSATVDYALDTGFSRSVGTETVVDVREHAGPGVTIDVDRPIVGVESTATVTVANGLTRDLRGLDLRLEGVPAERSRMVQSRLPAGETTSFTFRITPAEAGERRLSAILSYTIEGGTDRTQRTTKAVDVAPLAERVVLDATATSGAIEVTIQNLGNAAVEGIVVEGESDGAAVGRAIVDTLGPKNATTVTLPVTGLTGAESAEVSVRATYGLAGRPEAVGRAEGETITYAETMGASLTLTGVDVEPESGGRVQITGSASNVGLREAHSVIVRVVPAEGVTPAGPNREFFVGTVPASDFVSFDVFARVDDGVSEIPLEVSYLADGERKTTRISVPLESASVATPRERGGGGALLPALVGLVVITGVGAIIFVGWRRRRDDT